MNLPLYIYVACSLAGLGFHWYQRGKAEPARPSALKWFGENYGYALGSLGLTLACALFFMPKELGIDANASAVAFGITGGELIKSLFVRKA
jgi:hypothetical protein